MKNIIKSIIAFGAVAIVMGTSSCMKDLDALPIDPRETTPNNVYADADAYKQVLAKCYAGLALSGQQGPAGRPDISGIDEGFSTYLRQFFKVQELTTDEAICAWNDGNLRDYHDLDFDAQNEFVTAMYNRIYYQIVLVNEFIRESQDSKLSERGQNDIKSEVSEYRNEARFLRALSYFHALDLYGNVPFVTEENAVGSQNPKQISRVDLFKWLETELLDLEKGLKAPQSNEYGRVDKAAAWMLLSKLYLGAEVYTGTANFTEASKWADKVITEGGYTLASDYQHLFLRDNDVNSAKNEIIFPVCFDGNNSQTWGGMTYLVAAQIGGTMDLADFGTAQAWWGNRATSALKSKFDINNDVRAMFHEEGQVDEITDIFNFQQGVAIRKYKNVDVNGIEGSNSTFMDGDFPMMRLGEAYLIYAECAARGAGDVSKAVAYVNELRERAYGDNSANINASNLDLNFIIDERARELYWEMHRRTDLVRFGLLTSSNYIWPWKGGVASGQSVDEKYNLLPLPSSDINANSNLTQNSGY
jgi:starch-binding outer membrane protein, SusD/RagB family